MKSVSQILPSALTAASAPQTRELPRNTKAWAEWLKLDLHNDEELEALAGCCGEFGNAFHNNESPRWLTILGKTGTGKTHCARRLWGSMSKWVSWARADFNQREIYWPQFVSDLRSGGYFDQLRDMMRWPVLFLDDVGAERDTTGFASEQLNTLLGCRMDRWTILTSNLTLSQLGAIDPRIADRVIRPPNIFIEVHTKSHALRTLERRGT